ncbi:MAG TPA: hypothetical protein DF911_06150 [Erysipelotrichaceae bacterium]|nr:hypothetical protein [Erysipelotrichaceae bacterium]
MKQPYLVDVPVKTNIWIRPDLQRRQFEVIRRARPSELFIISDGGRNDEEWKRINESRDMFDSEIDWECKVHKYYADHNYGMYATDDFTNQVLWSQVDRCVILEDDILPSVSFFEYCRELLEKYKDDTRISLICGMNHEGISENVTADYLFTRYGSIWGVARWKRTVDDYQKTGYQHDPYAMECLKELLLSQGRKSHWKHIEEVAQKNAYDGHIPGDEYYMNLAGYAQNQLMIVPKKNLISNIGCDAHAAHSDSLDRLPKGIRRVFNMETYELEFPLKHPDYVFPDLGYEKRRNRIMAMDHPMVLAWRALERSWLILTHDGPDALKKKIQAVRGSEN